MTWLDELNLPLAGLRTLCRVDLCAPVPRQAGVDTAELDPLRLAAALPTLRHLISHGARVMLMAHLGAPARREQAPTLEPAAARLAEALNQDVMCVDDCVGDGVRKLALDLKDGQLLVLENLRAYAEEDANEEGFARRLTAHTDLYVNDAPGASGLGLASVLGVTRHVQRRAGGLSLKAEVEGLNRVRLAARAGSVLVLGGQGLDRKVGVINALLTRVETLVIGGALAPTFLKAAGRPVGSTPVEEDRLKLCQQILRHADEHGVRVQLPADHLVVLRDGAGDGGRVTDAPVEGEVVVDMGPATQALLLQTVAAARVVLWNGPLGRGRFLAASVALATAMAQAARGGAWCVTAGADTEAVVRAAGLSERMSLMSLMGPAALEVLSGNPPPALRAL